MNTLKTGTLSVPGACLYYEVRGAGPVLLMIHGGNGDAGVYAGAAEQLAERYTVVAYDRRGHSRSKLADEAERYRLETHSEDARHLLAELTAESAYVFGSSSGAVIGLDLAARHPDRIRMLVAHEPPLTHLLAGDEQVRARQIQENLETTNLREGAVAALKQFAAVLGMDNAVPPSFRPNAEQLARMMGNMQFFVTHEAPAIRRHAPDLEPLRAALRSTGMRLVAGGGSDSRRTFPYLCAAALAERLGIELAEFPGNHLGYVRHSKEFAAKLHDVLQQGTAAAREPKSKYSIYSCHH